MYIDMLVVPAQSPTDSDERVGGVGGGASDDDSFSRSRLAEQMNWSQSLRSFDSHRSFEVLSPNPIHPEPIPIIT